MEEAHSAALGGKPELAPLGCGELDNALALEPTRSTWRCCEGLRTDSV